jgi:hypothetical protein
VRITLSPVKESQPAAQPTALPEAELHYSDMPTAQFSWGSGSADDSEMERGFFE